MDDTRMSLITSRVYSYVRSRAARSKSGFVHVDLEELVVTLRRRYPTGERITIGEAHEALRILKLRRSIVGHAGFWRVCQQAHGTGTSFPPVPR